MSEVVLLVAQIGTIVKLFLLDAQKILDFFEFVNPAVVAFVEGLPQHLRAVNDHHHRVSQLQQGRVCDVLGHQLVDQLLHGEKVVADLLVIYDRGLLELDLVEVEAQLSSVLLDVLAGDFL
jgi:hypothetical protein